MVYDHVINKNPFRKLKHQNYQYQQHFEVLGHVPDIEECSVLEGAVRAAGDADVSMNGNDENRVNLVDDSED